MSKFKVGDKVRYTEYDLKGTIVEFVGEEYVHVRGFDDNKITTWRVEHCVLMSSLEIKSVFLEKLGDLLREFDAKINIGWNEYFDSDKCPCIDMDIIFGDGRGICFSNALDKTISADNIMDFVDILP